MEIFYKEVLDRDPFGFNYAGDLPAGDTITASSWTADVGITIDTPTFSGSAQTTSIWIQGGVPGGQYLIRNDVTSTAGRKRQRVFKVIVTDDAA